MSTHRLDSQNQNYNSNVNGLNDIIKPSSITQTNSKINESDTPNFVGTNSSNVPINSRIFDQNDILNGVSAINQVPIVDSPSSTTSSSQNIQGFTPLNPDKDSFLPNDLPETYTLSNYYKTDKNNNKIKNNNININTNNTNTNNNNNNNANDNNTNNNTAAINVNNFAEDDLLNIANNDIDDVINIPNVISLSNDDNLEDSQIDKNKALTSFKKPKQKKLVSSVPPKRPAFVVKLWKMVNDPNNDHYISWMKNGNAFQVNDRESFMKFVLPKYFKHSNFASFVRQLNMYGWHKIQDVNAGSLNQTEEIWQFENPNFIRGREDLLNNIVRNKPTRDEEDEVDLKQLLDQLEQMKRNQMLITEDLTRVRRDNELLWKENFVARERHKIQSETLDKIMRFLASVYGKNTSNLIEQIGNSNHGDLVEINSHPQNHHSYNYYTNSQDIINNRNNNNNNAFINNGIGSGNGNNNTNNSNNNNNNSNNNNNNNSNNNNNNNKIYQNSPQHHLQLQLQQQQRQQQQHAYNNRSINQFTQSRNQFYDSPNQHYSPAPYQARRQLMITNNANDKVTSPHSISRKTSRSSNELRMNNLGYVPSPSDNTDTSIQEIHRGPENRNSDTSKNYIQHVHDYVEAPRQFYGSHTQHSPYGQQYMSQQHFNPQGSMIPSPNGPIYTRSGVNQPAQQQYQIENDMISGRRRLNSISSEHSHGSYQSNPISQIQQLTPNQKIGESQLINKNDAYDNLNEGPVNNIINNKNNTTNYNNSNNDNNDNINFSNDNMPTEIMDSVQNRLHRNEGTLKQASEWLNKYNDNLDTDTLPLPEDFKVEDFLQQPLDLSVSATPIDFNVVDGFINTNTPITTPLLPQSQLMSPSISNSNNENKKRMYDQMDIGMAPNNSNSNSNLILSNNIPSDKLHSNKRSSKG